MERRLLNISFLRFRNISQTTISFTPLLLFVFIVTLTDYILSTIESNLIVDQYSKVFKNLNFEEVSPSFTELHSRLRWGISVLLSSLASVLLTVAITYYLLKLDTQRKYFLLFIYLISLPVFFIIFLESTYKFNMLFLSPTVYKLVENSTSIVTAVEVSGNVSLLGLAIVLTAQCYQATKNILQVKSDTLETVVKDVASLHRSTRILLYFATFSLIAGTLQSAALYSWARSLFPVTTFFEIDNNFVTDMSVLNGALYSILIASIFLPAFLLLKLFSIKLAKLAGHSNSAEREEWLSMNSLKVSMPNQIFSVLAILAPLLIGGPGISLIQVLTNI